MGDLKKLLNFFKNGRKKSADNASQKPKIQAFALEKLRTPSGLFDGLDDLDFSAFNPPFELELSESDEIELAPIEENPIPDGVEQELDSNALEEIPFLSPSEPEAIFESGIFTVGDSGQIEVDFLFDGGGYKGELAFFSLEGMEDLQPGSEGFIAEAASRALSNSELGHIVISDSEQGARFSAKFPWEGNLNSGQYQGIKTFQMRPGDTFAVMLVPNRSVEQLLDNPSTQGALRPLFSLVTANPDDSLQSGQIADVTGDGQTFVFEDLRLDGESDRDYNDIIFQIRGASGEAVHLDEVIDTGRDWRSSDSGSELLAYSTTRLEEIADTPAPEIEPIPDETSTLETPAENPTPSPDTPQPVAEGEIAEPSTEDTNPSPVAISSNPTLQNALNQARQQLATFSQKADSLEQLQLAFGNTIEPESSTQLIQQLALGEDLPNLETAPLAQLGVKGAYSTSNNTIYLADEFLIANSDNPAPIARVLLEEIGHSLDAQLNTSDTPGDEGAIFAAVVRGENLEQSELSALQNENDSSTITLAGQTLTLESNSGTGLLGTYYNTIDFNQPAISRTDPTIDYNWGHHSPHFNVGADTFSARWMGQVEPIYNEPYTFHTQADEGTRLWIDGQLIIDGWVHGGNKNSQPITLQAGQKYDIQLEYRENINQSNVKLLWSSAQQIKEVIPASALYPEDLRARHVQGTGTGLLGKYYNTPDFNQPAISRTDSTVDFDWGNGSPGINMGADTFSARWMGQIEPIYSQDYTFHTQADQGTRLWIDGELVIDGWVQGGNKNSQPITLQAGQKYDIQLEYKEGFNQS
ncbi:MAG: PA14 domain-containing protein, partial [Cyanobacteriota bacterium]|nr:PA14 domain-containing protein [Cyanobacteriota bacterium]